MHINDAWDSSICQFKLTNLWKPARLDNSAAFIELSRPHPVRGEGISPNEAAFLMPYSHCPAYLATGYFWYHDSELRKENALGWRGRLSNQLLVIWGVWVMQRLETFYFSTPAVYSSVPLSLYLRNRRCMPQNPCQWCSCRILPVSVSRQASDSPKVEEFSPLISPSGLIKLIWELSLCLTIEKHGTEVR
jgi:hypothetical protein